MGYFTKTPVVTGGHEKDVDFLSFDLYFSQCLAIKPIIFSLSVWSLFHWGWTIRGPINVIPNPLYTFPFSLARLGDDDNSLLLRGHTTKVLA